MRMKALLGALTIAGLIGVQANAANIASPASPTVAAGDGATLLAQYYPYQGRRPVYVAPRVYRPYPRPYYRHWVRRPYFGTVIAGVALGTVLTAAAVGAAPPPPAPGLCWYWADPSLTTGYWDYCR